MNQRTLPQHLAATAAADSRSAISTSRFSTHGLAPAEQFLAWRQRVGHVVDAPPSKAQVAGGFRGEIDLYAVGGMIFTDCRTDSMLLERSVARVSTDAITCFSSSWKGKSATSPARTKNAARRVRFQASSHSI
jgi:hypothetical protein